MIKVTRIAGESFDLETRQELPKAIILSNGKREYALFVGDDVAKDVLELMLESISTPTPKQESKPQPPRAPDLPTPGASPVPAPRNPPSEKPAQFMTSVGEPPIPESRDDEELEPGEEYNDPATGAESL